MPRGHVRSLLRVGGWHAGETDTGAAHWRGGRAEPRLARWDHQPRAWLSVGPHAAQEAAPSGSAFTHIIHILLTLVSSVRSEQSHHSEYRLR